MTVAVTKVTFLYAYLHDQGDAVTRAIRELGGELGDSGFAVTYLELKRNRRNRSLHQFLYLIKAAHAALFGQAAVIVTVDVPTGVGFAGRLAQAASRRKVRHIAWVMDLYHDDSRAAMAVVRAGIDRKSIRRADAIVTLGSCMANRLRLPCTVIPMWQDDRKLFPVSVPGRRDPVRILYSGHAGVRHDLLPVLDAALTLEGEQCEFVLAGRGQAFDQARSTLQARAASNVTFIEPVHFSQLNEFLDSGDLHLVVLNDSSTGTCVPSKAYTAMAVGRAVLFVGSRSSEVALEISRSGSGTAVSADGNEIAFAVRRYLEDRPALAEQGALGRDYLAGNRSLRTQSDQWERFLKGLLSEER